MENASKALLMAAEVLMAILVLTLFIFMINNLTGYFLEDTAAKKEEQLVKFNSAYSSYNRDDVRGTEILSLLAIIKSE